MIIFCLTFLTVSTQELTETSASVNFKIKNMGFNVDGKFTDVFIVSNFNSKNLSESFINGLVTVNSIDTDNRKRDKHLINKDYFESSSYEHLKIKSIKISKTQSGSYNLTANLTIKKTTKKIVIPIRVTETDSSVTISANFSINRLDYGVGESSWVMSDTVKIQVNFSGKK